MWWEDAVDKKIGTTGPAARRPREPTASVFLPLLDEEKKHACIRRTNERERSAAQRRQRPPPQQRGELPGAPAPATRAHFARASQPAAAAAGERERALATTKEREGLPLPTEPACLASPALLPASKQAAGETPTPRNPPPTWPPNVLAAREGDRRETAAPTAADDHASCTRRRDVGSNWTSAARGAVAPTS